MLLFKLSILIPLRSRGDLFRGLSVLDPPSPIPNLEVKQYSADGTTAARLWESRPLRDILFTLFLLPLFSYDLPRYVNSIEPFRPFCCVILYCRQPLLSSSVLGG